MSLETVTPNRRGTSAAVSAAERIASLLSDLVTTDGFVPSPLDGVKYMRVGRSQPRRPVMYEPAIVLIARGCKRGYLGDQVYTYDSRHYLVSALPVPFDCETIVGGDGPMLGLKIRIDVPVLAELMLQTGRDVREEPDTRPAIYATPVDPAMSEAAVRLLQCLCSRADTVVLGRQIVREITWRALCGPRGGSLRALAVMHSRIWPIHQVLRRIHDQYARPVDVSSLADESAMSLSAFHHAFKTATGTSPLQYVKTIRLQKARLLMAHEGLTAAEAAGKVGYESASQFNREFKRFFGRTPVTEADRLRDDWARRGTSGHEQVLS
jgi:AraC-like DNA-binding protein